MKDEKRNFILSILILSIFLLQSTALVSAFKPPIDDPPPTTYTYTFSGFVKNAETNTPLADATVKIYRGTTSLIKTLTTSSTGYYYYRYSTTSLLLQCKTVASKNGYDPSTKIVSVPDSYIRMDHYLVPSVTIYTITGHVEASDTDEDVVGADVDIFKSSSGGGNELIATTVTDSSGDFLAQYATTDDLEILSADVSVTNSYLSSNTKSIQVTGTTVNFGSIILLPSSTLPYNEVVYRDSSDCVSRWTKVLPGEIWDQGFGELIDGVLSTQDGYLTADIPGNYDASWHGVRYVQKLLTPIPIEELALLSLNLQILTGVYEEGQLFIDFYDSDGFIAFRVHIGDLSDYARAIRVGGAYFDSTGLEYGSFSDFAIETEDWQGLVKFIYRPGVGLNFLGPRPNLAMKENRLIDDDVLGVERERTIQNIVLSFTRHREELLTENLIHSISIHQYLPESSGTLLLWDVDCSSIHSDFMLNPYWENSPEIVWSDTATADIRPDNGHYRLWGNYNPNGEFKGPLYYHIFGNSIYPETLESLIIRVSVDRTNTNGIAHLHFFDQFGILLCGVTWNEEPGIGSEISMFWADDSGSIINSNNGWGTFTNPHEVRNLIFAYSPDGIVSTQRVIEGMNVGAENSENICESGQLKRDRKIAFAVLQIAALDENIPTGLRLDDIKLTVHDTGALWCGTPVVHKEAVFTWEQIQFDAQNPQFVEFNTNDANQKCNPFILPAENFVIGSARLMIEGYNTLNDPSYVFDADVRFYYGPEEFPDEIGSMHFQETGGFSFDHSIDSDIMDDMWFDPTRSYFHYVGIQPSSLTQGEWLIRAYIAVTYVAAENFRIQFADAGYHEKGLYGEVLDVGVLECTIEATVPESYLDIYGGCRLFLDTDSTADDKMMDVYLENDFLGTWLVPNGCSTITLDVTSYIIRQKHITIRCEIDSIATFANIGIRASISYLSRLSVLPDESNKRNTDYIPIFRRYTPFSTQPLTDPYNTWGVGAITLSLTGIDSSNVLNPQFGFGIDVIGMDHFWVSSVQVSIEVIGLNSETPGHEVTQAQHLQNDAEPYTGFGNVASDLLTLAAGLFVFPEPTTLFTKGAGFVLSAIAIGLTYVQMTPQWTLHDGDQAGFTWNGGLIALPEKFGGCIGIQLNQMPEISDYIIKISWDVGMLVGFPFVSHYTGVELIPYHYVGPS